MRPQREWTAECRWRFSWPTGAPPGPTLRQFSAAPVLVSLEMDTEGIESVALVAARHAQPASGSPTASAVGWGGVVWPARTPRQREPVPRGVATEVRLRLRLPGRAIAAVHRRDGEVCVASRRPASEEPS